MICAELSEEQGVEIDLDYCTSTYQVEQDNGTILHVCGQCEELIRDNVSKLHN